MKTASADRLVEQLCRHWAHKLAIERGEGSARIVMPSGAAVTLGSGAGALRVGIEAADAAQLAETREVVERHLDRFAFREAPLAFDWTG